MALVDNILSYWKLDESSGNAADATGTGNTLVNTGSITYGTGLINNGAYTTYNTGQYLSIANGSQTGLNFGSSNFTWNMWVYPTAYNTLGNTRLVAYLMAKYDSDTSNRGPLLYFEEVDGNQKITYTDSSDGSSGTQRILQTITLPPLNTWTMVTLVVVAGTSSTVYINASSVGSGGAAATMYSNTASFGIGVVNGSNSLIYSGRTDEVGVWLRALSGAEVTELYNGGAGLSYPFVSGPANLKSFDGNLKANIKSISGNVIANVKSLSGNS